MNMPQAMIPETIWSESRPRTVFLARHGQSESNAEERISGQADTALTEKGRRQAQRLATALQGIPLTRILTSSLKRSMETAGPTAELQGIAACPTDSLREMSFGILEGRLRNHLDQESQSLLDRWTQDKLHFRIPSGENLLDVRNRVVPLLSKVFAENPNGTLLIVGHRHTNLVILSVLMGWDLTSTADSSIRSKYLYEIDCTATPLIHTTCLTGAGRGSRVEGFLDEENSCAH